MSATLPIFLVTLTFACAQEKQKPEFSDEIKEIINHIHGECVTKTGVAEEDIQNCEKGIFKEDMKLKCYMFCLLEEASIADEDGVVDYDMMVSLIPEQYYDRVSKMLFACKHLDTMDKHKCQRAFDVHKCSYKTDPDTDEDGVVDYDMMVSLIPEQYYDRVSKMLFACKHLDTMDKHKCQRAFDVHKCSYKTDPDLYFLM